MCVTGMSVPQHVCEGQRQLSGVVLGSDLELLSVGSALLSSLTDPGPAYQQRRQCFLYRHSVLMSK